METTLDRVFTPRTEARADTRYCAICGTHRKLHDTTTGACPSEYRPADLATAMRELAAAKTSKDNARIFAARGDVQRLGGNPDLDDGVDTDVLVMARRYWQDNGGLWSHALAWANDQLKETT